MEQLVDKNPRIEVVDALRGGAVMAILIVHNLEHFIFPVYPANPPEWLNALDQGVSNVVFSLFAGKAYAIFALLFGLTFHIQTSNQRRRGGDFGYRFLWRLVLLAVFASLNAAFFPGGDVLMLFVVVGFLLFVVRNWSDRALLAAAAVFLMQPFEWFRFAAAAFDPSFMPSDFNVGGMYAEVVKYAKSGSFWDFIWCNITLGQKASLMWAVNGGRLFQTAGLFLLGFYMGRRRLFACSEENIRFWVKTLAVSAVAFAPLHALKELAMKGGEITRQTAAVSFDMWQKLAFAMVLIASFVLLYRGEKFSRAVGSLRFYGRMSLTNYIFQSVIGAVLYFPFGLYLAPHCGYAASLLIGVFTFFIQVKFCKWWLSKYRQGPLEYIWHKWTWAGAKKA